MTKEWNPSAARLPGNPISRRDFLKVGSTALGTMALNSSVSAAPPPTGKSLIHIYLPGGPSHLDTFDLKPCAPKELRGEFQPIRTNVPGIEICEHFPKLARVADRFSIIRSITDLYDQHSSSVPDSGWTRDSLSDVGGRPGMAAVISALRLEQRLGQQFGLPVSVDLTGWTNKGYLADQAPTFQPRGRNLDRNQTLSSPRDGKCSSVDTSPEQNAISSIALDCFPERAQILGRYGIAGAMQNARFLQARRLVEAGVTCVAFEWGYWDTHGNNFGQLRKQLPALDRGLSALIEDLDARGLLKETLILMSGEFGRTPEINDGAGRDHWPEASFAFLAGGQLPHGRVLGRTDSKGRFPMDAVSIQSVLAAAYAELGVHVDNIRFKDCLARTHRLFDRPGLASRLS